MAKVTPKQREAMSEGKALAVEMRDTGASILIERKTSRAGKVSEVYRWSLDERRVVKGPVVKALRKRGRLVLGGEDLFGNQENSQTLQLDRQVLELALGGARPGEAVVSSPDPQVIAERRVPHALGASTAVEWCRYSEAKARGWKIRRAVHQGVKLPGEVAA